MFGNSPKLKGIQTLSRELDQIAGSQESSILIRTNMGWAALPPLGTQYILRSGTNGSPYNPPAWISPPAAGSNDQIQYNNGGNLAGNQTVLFNSSNGGLRIQEGGSAQYCDVGGAHSQGTFNTGSAKPVSTTGFGEDTLLVDTLYANTFSVEGASFNAKYAGIWQNTLADTNRIRVYIEDGSNVYQIYDTGTVTNTIGGGDSKDYFGTINGGAAAWGWALDVDILNYDSSNQTASTIVRFTTEDLSLISVVPPMRQYRTGFLGFYGGFGDLLIRVTGESTTADGIQFWQSKTLFSPHNNSHLV